MLIAQPLVGRAHLPTIVLGQIAVRIEVGARGVIGDIEVAGPREADALLDGLLPVDAGKIGQEFFWLLDGLMDIAINEREVRMRAAGPSRRLDRSSANCHRHSRHSSLPCPYARDAHRQHTMKRKHPCLIVRDGSRKTSFSCGHTTERNIHSCENGVCFVEACGTGVATRAQMVSVGATARQQGRATRTEMGRKPLCSMRSATSSIASAGSCSLSGWSR